MDDIFQEIIRRTEVYLERVSGPGYTIRDYIVDFIEAPSLTEEEFQYTIDEIVGVCAWEAADYLGDEKLRYLLKMYLTGKPAYFLFFKPEGTVA